ncbi:MAG: S1 RNA-binding domain-containing protein [Alphaproteobacteria bacterium]|nr:S1 RNA-binding domain-containing protein [Alphaproteobacteria bacterium]MCB9791650.1 S1 RNA-binding domain-containing protein [Alphaproteobacteria bacterium]
MPEQSRPNRVVRRRRSDDIPARPTAAPEEVAPSTPETRPAQAATPAAPQLDAGALDDLAHMNADDFAALFDGAAGLGGQRLRPGQQVSGRVLGVGGRFVFVDVGGKAEATVDIDDFEESGLPSPGDAIEAYVVTAREGEVRLATRLRGPGVDDALKEAMDAERPVEGRVAERNAGGFSVDIGGKRAFCPVSQIAARPGEDLDVWVGRTLRFKILEIREGDVVVSHRAIEREEREAQAAETLAELRAGQVRDGVVSSLRPFGAFVDLGGVEGLVHISRVADKRIEDPSEVLKVGQSVRVRVLDVDPGGRISLSIRDADAPRQAPAAAAPRADAPKSSESGGFGTFADLLKGAKGR